jgi:transposase
MFLMERAEEIEEMLKKIYKDREFNKDTDILTSIKGIGDIKRFESCRKLIACAGLDQTVYQSGRYQGKSKLSKRGNRHIRRVIWLMTSMIIRFNEVFRAHFVKRRKEGLPYKKAVIATAHKLIRVIFSILSHKTYFSYKYPSIIVYQEVNS